MAEAAQAAPPSPRSWTLRLALGGTLALVEYLVVSFLFDARHLTEQAGAHHIVGYVGDVAVLAMVAVAATLAFRGGAIRHDLGCLGSAPPLRSSAGAALLHFAAYGLFMWLTALNFEGMAEGATPLSIALWIAAAVAVAGTLATATVPPAAMAILVPRLAPSLLVGVACGAVAWLFGHASANLWRPLGQSTLTSVIWLLQLVTPNVLYDVPTMLVGLPGFTVEVSRQCSGFEGMGLITAFLGGYVLLYRSELRLARVLLLVPLGIACAWISNVIRIAALVLVGGWYSPAVALGGFHSKAGWLFFCLISLTFITVVRSSRHFVREAAPAPPISDSPATAFLMPLLVLVGTTLITGLLTSTFDTLYPVRIAACALALFYLRRSYRDFQWGMHWESVAIGVAVYGLWFALVPSDEPSPIPAGLEEIGPGLAALWLGFRVVGSVVFVPIAEELAFRGYLLRRLQASDFTSVSPGQFGVIAWLLSSLAFGLLHSQWIAGTAAGLAYALAQQRRGRITDAIVSHAVTNALIAIQVLAFGAWSLW